MTPHQQAKYQRLRSDGWRAIDAHRYATYKPRYQFDWDGDGRGTLELDGVTFVAKVENDDYIDWESEFGSFESSPSKPIVRGSSHRVEGFENPDWRKDNWWRYDPDQSKRWFYTSSGETFQGLWDYNRKSTGLPRHDAWLKARRQMLEWLDDLERAFNDNPPWDVMAVEVTAYVGEDIEVNQTSMGGYGWKRDYSAPLDPQLDEMVADVMSECVSTLIDGMKATIEQLHKDQATTSDALLTVEQMVGSGVWLH